MIGNALKCFGCHGTKEVCEENAVETACTSDMAHQSARILIQLGYHTNIEYERESSKYKCFHETARNSMLLSYRERSM